MSTLFEWKDGDTSYRIVRFEGYLRIEEDIRGEWRGVQQDRIVAIRALEAVLGGYLGVQHELAQVKAKHARTLAETLRSRQ